jgi:hypothetical protein
MERARPTCCQLPDSRLSGDTNLRSRSRSHEVARDAAARHGGRPQIVAEWIAERIESGEWAELPPIGGIATACGYGRASIAVALHELADRGVVGKDYTAGSIGRWAAISQAQRCHQNRYLIGSHAESSPASGPNCR